MKMRNETAIVTGSTSGIGKKIAELFLKEGCKVAICSRSKDKVDKTLAEFKEKFGDSVIGAPCDVTDPNAIKSLVDKTIETFGSVRILVANAGVNLLYGPFRYIPLEKANSLAKTVIDINLIGMINSVAAVMPHMINQSYGRIVTLSGGGADRPVENMTIYAASKGGVLAFSKCLVAELKKMEQDIKVNMFSPGMIDTNLATHAEIPEGWKDKDTYEREYELIKKYVMTDAEESCKNVIPFALPSCKKNGKNFRGFSIMKLIKGFKKIKKEMKLWEEEDPEYKSSYT
jgi:NAD(P)-dependent dehydrogenase (short-subunit alcohol dehydrogenase family)